MGKKATAPDLYMNFAPIRGVTGVAATTLEESKINTGLSVRGELIWLMHMAEITTEIYPTPAAGMTLDWALSTIDGLAVMPEICDKGCLVRGRVVQVLSTNGGLAVHEPYQASYLPPVPIASPQLSLYLQMGSAHASYNSKGVDLRICFTTAPLDMAVYTEIAETWGY